MRHHKPSFRNWIKYTNHSKVVLACFMLVFGGVGVVVLRQSLACCGGADYEIVAYDSNTNQFVDNGKFKLFRRDNASSPWVQYGFNEWTTPAHGGSSSNPQYKTQLISPPPGYLFLRWSPGTGANTESSVFTGTYGQATRVIMYVSKPPTVQLKANGQSSSTVAKGAALSLSWTTTNGPGSCTASGAWSGSKTTTGGSENRTVDTATAGTKTYILTCSTAGTNATSTATVTVTNPSKPVQPVNPVQPVTPVRPGPVQPGPSAPDTEPPSVPSDFLAVADEEQGVVKLTWTPSTDNIGVDHYQLERSIDQTAWESLSDSLLNVEYVDTGTNFTTKYFYRVRAFDIKGNVSGYATTDVTTAAFKVNVTVAEGGEITTEDNAVVVTFPASAVTEDSQCSVSDSEEIVDVAKGHQVVNGPYKVVCKTASNTIITTFGQPLQVSVTTTRDIRKKHSAIEIVALNSDKWETVASQNDGEKDTFELVAANNFAVVGQVKATPVWIKILLIFLLLAGIGGAVIGVLYVRYRRSQQAQYDDYMRQQSGLWK